LTWMPWLRLHQVKAEAFGTHMNFPEKPLPFVANYRIICSTITISVVMSYHSQVFHRLGSTAQ
jgi:hypothetical protein